MLLEESLDIMKDILLRTNITDIEIREASESLYGEIDPKTEEVIEKTLREEYDLVIKEDDLSHSEIQELHQILEPFPHIEMRLRYGHIEIFSTKKEEEVK